MARGAAGFVADPGRGGPRVAALTDRARKPRAHRPTPRRRRPRRPGPVGFAERGARFATPNGLARRAVVCYAAAVEQGQVAHIVEGGGGASALTSTARRSR